MWQNMCQSRRNSRLDVAYRRRRCIIKELTVSGLTVVIFCNSFDACLGTFEHFLFFKTSLS